MTTSLELNRELDSMANDLIASDGQTSSGSSGPAPSLPVSFTRPVSSTVADFPESDRQLAMGVHIASLSATLFSGGLFLPVLVPLLAKIVLKDNSQGLQEHVRQQLNFQITLAIVAVVGVIGSIMTLGIGVFAFVPIMLFFLGVEVVASVKGTLAAQRGEDYAFPFTLDIIKETPPTRSFPR